MIRGEHNSDSSRFFDWLKKAKNDLDAAKILKDDSGPNEMAAFHCQQCIEKALKAYLLLKFKHHFDGHNLTFLCRKALQADNKFYEWLDESAMLNRYYIETRYPSDMPFFIDDNRLESIYEIAKDMYDFIFSEIFGINKSLQTGVN